MVEQHNLFEEEKPQYITIQGIIDDIGVSRATIRNWIKANYIDELEKGKISRESYQNFCENVLGKEKLNQRANKSLKDTHNQSKLVDEYLLKIEKGNINIHTLGDDYEKSLSDSYRNKEGIYYTPKKIVEDLFFIEDVKNKSFCDPCCGGGNFIIRAIDLGFSPENIFGFDTDPIAVEITKKRIFEKTGYQTKNIICVDFLDYINETTQKFDVIYTNPPWGKKIQKESKIKIAGLLNAEKTSDTSTLFFLACLKVLSDNGSLGLLLPDAFFNIGNYNLPRLKALEYKIKLLKDYGKAFKGLQTGAVGMVLEKKASNEDDLIKCVFEDKEIFRKNQSFVKNPKQIFNISCNADELKVIEEICKKPYLTLKNSAVWGLGIVTGNNAKFLKKEGAIPIYKGSDITKNGMKEPTHFINDDFSEFQQVAPMRLFRAKEKMIYKFISSNLCFYNDTEQRFVLNSANFLIVDANFPVSMKVLTELFNSDFMNWLFKKIFNTHKVLRGDLETLPIHTQFLQKGFSEAKYLESLGIEKIENGTYRVKKSDY